MIGTTADGGLPPTYFAPPERATEEELRETARVAAESPLVSTLVHAFGSLVAVLDRHRQILAVNDGLLRFLGIADAAELLGLRPGEAFRCVHSADHPAGCGTSRFCTTCGAAIAIVLAQQEERAVERECLLTVRGEREEALELGVRVVPLPVGEHPLVLLLLQDIRDEKRRQSLEHTFFHDLNNTLMGVAGYAELLVEAEPEVAAGLAEKLEQITFLAAEEVRSYQLLARADAGEYEVVPRALPAGEVVETLRRTFDAHPAAAGRELRVSPPPPGLALESDPSLVHRVLVNMVKNALEATAEGGTVRVECSGDAETVGFRVWNAGAMPAEVAMRVFQRYFSTKPGAGRGLGTYGMKMLGEHYLHGAVGFSSTPEAGTTFHLNLPRRWNGRGHA